MNGPEMLILAAACVAVGYMVAALWINWDLTDAFDKGCRAGYENGYAHGRLDGKREADGETQLYDQTADNRRSFTPPF
jgi:hypothetical protein